MARSPFFSLLRRARHLRHLSQATGLPLHVVAERDEVARAERAGLSRRTFLAASGATALASACPAPLPPPPSPGGKPRVAIVGAGMAGLHCAYRLLDLGVSDLVVYEAQNRLGGRMISDRSTFAPLHCELGGELIDTPHLTMLDLAAEFGLDLLDYREDDRTLDAVTAFFGGARLDIAALLSAYEPIAARIDADLLTISGDGFVTYDAPNGGEALDNLSIKGWFDALVADETIGADNIARTVFELAYNIEYGREVDEQSVLNLMFLTSTSATDLALFGESDELFHTAAGNDTFITRLAEAVGESRIERGHHLTSVKTSSSGQIRLSFDTAGGVVEVDADEVVIALPFTVLREVEIDDAALKVSPQKRLAIDTIGYGTNAKLMIGFTERFWRNKAGVNTSNGEVFSDTGFQATWETSRLQTLSTEGIITNFSGGDRGVAVGAGTPQERTTEFLAEFEQIFPGISATHNNKVARFHWPTNPFVKASYASYEPGQYSTICGSEIEAEADGHLHFCGEHTSLDAQGYMEGAALTGAAAAVGVADNLGAGGLALLATGPAARILARARTVKDRRRHRRAAGRQLG